MASQKFGFVTVDPVSGSGVQAVSLTGDVHTGRLQRTKAFNVTATGVEAPKVLTVNQSAAEENVKAASPTASIEKTGGSVTITGTSNSTKLTFAVNPGADNQLAWAILWFAIGFVLIFSIEYINQQLKKRKN